MGSVDIFDDVRATRDMCAWCFSGISYSLDTNNSAPRGDHPAPPNSVQKLISRKVSAPLFVTWMTVNDSRDSTESTQLRGCIGTLESVPIKEILSFAYQAAFNDSRFPPITRDELCQLECHVSLLYGFQKCSHPKDWDIQLDGIEITFVIKSFSPRPKTYHATFLPGVAYEHSMTHDSTLEHLIRKAGWCGAIDNKLLNSLQVVRYRSSLAELRYSDYVSEYCA